METIAFRMQLFPGFDQEYKKRHDMLWPELKVLLKQAGIQDYAIFYDPSTNGLFAILKTDTPHGLETLSTKEVMRRWWAYMADIMETNPDGSPRTFPMNQVFFMP